MCPVTGSRSSDVAAMFCTIVESTPEPPSSTVTSSPGRICGVLPIQHGGAPPAMFRAPVFGAFRSGVVVRWPTRS